MNFKKLLEKKRVFAFDLDGTVLDTMGPWNRLDNKIIEIGNGIPDPNICMERDFILEKYKSDLDKYRKWEEYLVSRYSLNISVEEVRKFRSEIPVKDITYKEGAKELLEKLKDKNAIIWLVTLAPLKAIKVYDDNLLLLKYFGENIISAYDVSCSKPSGECYLKLLEKTGVSKEEILIFEDAKIGVMAAREAGIDVIAVKEDSAMKDIDYIKSNSTFYLDSFFDILDLV